MDTKTPFEPADSVSVGVQTFAQLFSGQGLPLAIDTYQRGFVWNDEKIKQLALDLAEYQDTQDPKPDYYMGTVLLHRNDAKQLRFIIDGQQRLTALCLLHSAVRGNLPGNCAMTYSPASARRIRSAAEVYRQEAPGICDEIFNRIVFTVVMVDDVDLAFTFFDTQNNRGVPLHATDLLKAHHLRVVAGAQGAQRERLQEVCARRWEGLQQGSTVISHEQEFTASLFGKFLWRARSWTGKQVASASHDALLHEFERDTWPVEEDHATVPLYSSRNNRMGAALTLNAEGACEIQLRPLVLGSRPTDLPFAIRQPIHKGIGFFLYTDKYAALLRRLLHDEAVAPEILRARELYQTLVMTNSLFLREIHVLALLMFADQFGDSRLWEFSLWLEHALGALRLNQDQVRRETAQKFFRDADLNLLDVIAGAYRPEQVIRHLRQNTKTDEAYAQEQVQRSGSGVQARYKQAVLRYFHKEADSLQHKRQWIEAALREHRA
ncbi:DUF262 domain-containing protein [Ramlibacter sp. G-1-2-2]|uniref:DUF262 domain-containing protein n=1 Tax=Ramlibacter agri TaxID=2728837 RepID=A0A848H099_9BURK|nr:DUF262 domain-containing protein [Ramlibacter agri]NML42500.1 DUF262 domain-containing protein [Ramlibacter agri]